VFRLIFLIIIFFKISQITAYSDEIPIIVITASKTTQSYSSVGSAISSIDSEVIDNSGEFFLSDILDNNLPGMNYFRSGGDGTVTGIQLRGLPKRYSTVYIDGVKMSDPSTSDNSFYFSNVMNSSVERVEVLRGSQSSVYGSGAIGGTINIFTKEGNSDDMNRINITKGSNNTKNLDLSYGDSDEKYNYFVGINKFVTGGISSMNDVPSINDNDGYKNEGFIGNYSYQFNDIFSFKSSLRYSNSFLEYDEVTSGRTDENNSTENTELTYNLRLINDKDKWKNTLIYNYTNIERATKTYKNVPKNYYGYRDAINFIGEYNINLDTKIIYGLDNEFDRAKFQKDWPTDYLESDEAIYSQYLDFQFRPKENLYSTIGFRRDDHTTAGSYNTGRVTAAYKLNNFSKIRSSYGTGIRYPSLYDYFYGTVVESKEDLKPEESKSFDIGYETKFNKINTDFIISAFKIEYKDPLESWESNGWTVKNSNGKITSKGIELSSIWRPKNTLNITLNYNYNDTYDGADCDDPDKGTNCIDESMVRVPRHSFISLIKHNFTKNFSNKLSIKYSGEVRDYGNGNNSFKDVILDDFIKFDYAANYKLYDTYNLYFNLNNIFDENYEQAFMYSSMERSLNIGIKNNY